MIMDSTAQFSPYFNMCLKILWKLCVNIIDTIRKLYYSFTNFELFMVQFDFVSNYTIWWTEILYFRFFCFPAQQKSRCEECNINFSKHQNYIAHKKYYCSAVAAGTAATGGPNTGSGGPGGNKSGVGGPSGGQSGLPILSDNDDDKSSDDGKSQSHRKLSPPIASPSALMLGLTSPNRKEGKFYFSMYCFF